MARKDKSYMAAQLLAGGGSEYYTPNRWFDKFLQVSACPRVTIHLTAITIIAIVSSSSVAMAFVARSSNTRAPKASPYSASWNSS